MKQFIELSMKTLKNTFLSILYCMFSTSISIEILQYILGVGVSDIDDVLLNVIGGIWGYYLYKILKK